MAKIKKSKYNRRRAIDCKLIEKSKSNPGYLKYQVTIAEKDGTVHKQPAYGVDMQDALSRLINKERTVKVEKKLTTSWFLAIWVVAIGLPAILVETNNSPKYLFYPFAGIILLTGILAWWYHYVNKGEE